MNDDLPPEGVPDRRKTTIEALEGRLDDHAEKIEKRLERFFRKALVILSVVGLISAIALAGFGYLLSKQSETTEAIQQQREESIRANCTDQNNRNKDTSAQLIVASNEAEAAAKTEELKVQIRKSRDISLALINALAPYQDCEALVARSVQDLPISGG